MLGNKQAKYMGEKRFDPDNPFYKALQGLKFPEKKPEEESIAETKEPVAVQSGAAKEEEKNNLGEFLEGGGPVVMRDYDETPRWDRSANLRTEDDELASRIFTLLGIYLNDRRQTKRIGSIQRMVQASRYADVSYDCDRWLTSTHLNSELDKIRGMLLKRGYKMAAVNWLLSLRRNELQYGPKSQTIEDKKRTRLDMARKYAEKTGAKLEDIAKEYNLEYLLNA